MIIDASTYVGHWPFRALPHKRVTDLLRQMDGHGIDMAVVSSIHGMFYKDAHEANHELHRETQRHRDRLIPFGTLNPNYPGWVADLKQCHEDFEMPGLRLFPQYHNYSLAEPHTAELVGAATARNMVISFAGRIVDNRGRHHMDLPREAAEQEITALFRRTPKARFLLVNFMKLPGGHRWERPQVWMDMCRLHAAPRPDLANLVELTGADRVVFGTSMLFRYARPPLIAMDLLEASKSVKDRIYCRNIADLLGLKV